VCLRLGLTRRARQPPPSANVLPLTLSVSDTGIGIRDVDIQAVFLKYTKATDSRGGHGVDRHAGAGLGLSICKAPL